MSKTSVFRERRLFLSRNFFLLFILDLFFIVISWLASYAIRFEFDIPDKFLDEMFALVPAIVLIKIGCFYFFNLYRGMWRFTSINDLFNVIKGVSLSTLLIIVWIVVIYRYHNVPRSVVFIDFCLNILLISGIRLAIRIFFQKYVPTHPIQSLIKIGYTAQGSRTVPNKRLLIIGAGTCGEKILREINDNPQLHYSVVGFLDDNSNKVGHRIHGVPVRGIISDLPYISEQIEADELLIAIPSASSSGLCPFASKVAFAIARYRGTGN